MQSVNVKILQYQQLDGNKHEKLLKCESNITFLKINSNEN